jgi:hypothetical protein
MIGQVIYGILNHASINALVGTRIHPHRAAQATDKPYITYTRTGTTPNDTKLGPSKLDEVFVSITSWSLNYLTAEQIAEAVRTRMDRYSGTISVGGATHTVQSVQYQNTDELFDEASRAYGVEQDYKIRLVRA